MASIKLTQNGKGFYGYANGNTTHGYYNVTFNYGSATRDDTNITFTDAYIRMENPNSGYTTNTVFVDSVTIGSTNVGISGSEKGDTSYHKWSTKSKTVTATGVGGSTTSLTVTMKGHRSGQNNGAQTLTGTVSVPAGNYTVSYNANGGTGAPSAQVKEHNKTLTLSTIKPSRGNSISTGYTITLNANGGYVSTPELTQYNTTSYTFRSWNTNSSGTGTTYNSGGSYTANANATLYAIWNTSITKGSVTLPTPARANYSFVGWGTTASATTGVTGTITPTSSQTLYAVWERTPSLINWRDSAGNFTSGGTISVKDSNGKWVVINKIKIKNSSGVWEEH